MTEHFLRLMVYSGNISSCKKKYNLHMAYTIIQNLDLKKFKSNSNFSRDENIRIKIHLAVKLLAR